MATEFRAVTTATPPARTTAFLAPKRSALIYHMRNCRVVDVLFATGIVATNNLILSGQLMPTARTGTCWVVWLQPQLKAGVVHRFLVSCAVRFVSGPAVCSHRVQFKRG